MGNQIINKILANPVIPVFYDDDLSICIQVLESCYRGGIRVFEFVNRGEAAEENFRELFKYKNQYFPDLSLGIGTILNADQAKRFIALDADFLVSPLFSDAIAQIAKANDSFWIPGCMTPSEIGAAHQAGFNFIKIFPGGSLGPSFVKGIRPIFPDIYLMPTGGVECTQSSIKSWFDAGVNAVGLGSKLFEKIGQEYQYEQIQKNCAALLGWAPKG